MVPPTHYGVEYEINPWMSRRRPAVPELARRQWQALRDLLTGPMGAEVCEAPPEPGLPDMVFTANAGLVQGQRVVLSNFRHPERQQEAAHFRAWFESNGFEVALLPGEHRFEGQGDALPSGEELFAGYHYRTDVEAHRLVGEILERRVLSLHLVDPYYYHLDTCFCPINRSTVAYYPAAFDDYGRRVIQESFEDRIELAPEEAGRFAANAVVLGEQVALNWGCPGFEAALRDRGCVTHATPLDEFLKAGGSARCLTLHLDWPAQE